MSPELGIADKCFTGFELDLARGKVRAGVAGLAGVDGANGRVDCFFVLADNDHIAFGNFHDQLSPAIVSQLVLLDQGPTIVLLRENHLPGGSVPRFMISTYRV